MASALCSLEKSKGELLDDNPDALLISRAKDCDAISDALIGVSKSNGLDVGTSELFLFLAPRFRRRGRRDDVTSSPCVKLVEMTG
jgi:hypothetical protein